MGRVTVRLEKGLDPRHWAEPAGAGDVIGRIWRVRGSTGGDADPDRGLPRSIVIPVGSGQPQEVNLPLGRYVIDALLPSGELVSEDVVVESDNDLQVYLYGKHSGHEWLSWQHLVGNVRAGPEFFESLRLLKIRRDDSPMVGRWSPWFVVGQPSTEPSESDPFGKTLRLASPGPQTGRIPLALAASKPRPNSRTGAESDGPFGSFVLKSPASLSGRRYIVVEGERGAFVLAVLPIPWQETRTAQGAEIDILVGPKDSAVSELERTYVEPDCSIMVRDSRLSTLVAYLASGDIAAAAAVLARAQDMLFAKLQNPIAAAAGGYVLLANWSSTYNAGPQSQPEWHGWLGNLSRWFEWLPDGAIQNAWLSLQTRGGHGPHLEARDLALMAYRRGIPYYTAGVRMLLDTLILLSDQSRLEGARDHDVEDALAATRGLALMIEPSRPFTTLRMRLDEGHPQ